MKPAAQARRQPPGAAVGTVKAQKAPGGAVGVSGGSASATDALAAIRASARPRRRAMLPVNIGARADYPSRVLGLDLAINTTGWCLLVGGAPAAHGSFHLPERGKNQPLASWLGRRAVELGRQMRLLLTEHQPEVVGYEYPDSPRPAWSGGTKGREFSAVQGLSRAEGFLVAQWANIGGSARLVAVPASLVRRTAATRANATKDQVAYGLRVYRGWDLSGWSHDETDAAAVALAARETL